MMNADGWNLDGANLLGNEVDIPALRQLARGWAAMTPAEREQQVAALQARYPDLELTPDDVAMMIEKFNEMGDLP